MPDDRDGLYVVIGGDIAPLRAALADASRLSASFAGNLTNAFTDATLKGRELSDVVRQLALNLSQNTLEAALAPISKTFGDALSGLVTGAGLGSALPVPFAKGGVISSPMTFPLGQGAPRGLAGEAGPEAVLPLARAKDGRLGVQADGAGRAVNVTFNVTTPDAESFRRSEGQLAAMLSRTVGRGQRNL
ncbi:phage tail tape measure protein [Methyloceanibacter caenitepidi]|uniref:Gene transfer agent tail tape measure n=1 Tax=Methyloceanibacter caenitepidi TaxID=1384459 RepID=A0A0A8K4X8_9HYPH|nr:phage tail tape measure protein [Methyloceanibacter caenitepidi]BAQ17993.1 gene transfer agent tail tape measure [Methyloceanibacter caenitepidi]